MLITTYTNPILKSYGALKGPGGGINWVGVKIYFSNYLHSLATLLRSLAKIFAFPCPNSTGFARERKYLCEGMQKFCEGKLISLRENVNVLRGNVKFLEEWNKM